uniref:Uncharacterized protein n=1 Tax=Rhizophora mucronata TaxID=61149 RepID=A0A2P2PZJ6_RHIMU
MLDVTWTFMDVLSMAFMGNSVLLMQKYIGSSGIFMCLLILNGSSY